MMKKSEVKLLKGFMIEYKLTQKEFAKEAGISDRTLRKALKDGNVSSETRNKIYDAMISETLQHSMLSPDAIDFCKSSKFMILCNSVAVLICVCAIGLLLHWILQ